MDTTITETGKLLDGPEFVKWLEDHGLVEQHRQLGPGLARRIDYWREGSHACVYAADRALVKLGIHPRISIREPPEGLFLEPRASIKGPKLTSAARAHLCSLLRAPKPPSVRALARDFGVSPSTVRHHKRRLQTAA